MGFLVLFNFSGTEGFFLDPETPECFPPLYGNDICDEINNSFDCSFDGGDCDNNENKKETLEEPDEDSWLGSWFDY